MSACLRAVCSSMSADLEGLKALTTAAMVDDGGDAGGAGGWYHMGLAIWHF